MKRSLGPRKTVNLSQSFQHRLNSYALAATAAGVGALAAAQPSEAKIIYTPAHKTINWRTPYDTYLDLNHDGIKDFGLAGHESGSFPRDFSAWLGAQPVAQGAAIWSVRSYKNHMSHSCDAALPYGKRIGPRGRFNSTNPNLFMFFATLGFLTYTSTICPWRGKITAYLGLKFLIKGETHYGWARVRVETPGHGVDHAKVIVTGYAYETTPNKPIIAGKTKGRDVITVEPASLGRLAQGSAGRLGK